MHSDTEAQSRLSPQFSCYISKVTVMLDLWFILLFIPVKILHNGLTQDLEVTAVLCKAINTLQNVRAGFSACL